MSNTPNAQQQKVIDATDSRLLVSASAGTGKTTTMINRICNLLKDDKIHLSDFMLVTFTNLAAAEMKKKLISELSKITDNKHIDEELEKIDNASISTLHVFCSDILRNYFYVVDIDPSFSILDTASANTLMKSVWDDVFEHYYTAGDETFLRIRKLSSYTRKEDDLRNELTALYEFSKCLPSFEDWYNEARQNFVNYSPDNKLVTTFAQHLTDSLDVFVERYKQLTKIADNYNAPRYMDVCHKNIELLENAKDNDFDKMISNIIGLELLGAPTQKEQEIPSDVHKMLKDILDEINNTQKKLTSLCSEIFGCRTMQEAFDDVIADVAYTDKIVEILTLFDQKYSAIKKQRGTFDFNDLEHFALKVLQDADALKAIHARYKYIFVDEYQDTNPVQEEIVKLLSTGSNLFMVGDAKQSIYGFRHCEPGIFIDKAQHYRTCPDDGTVIELQENYRSNKQILDFVNMVFSATMTSSFGKIDYTQSALVGSKTPTLTTPSVQVDLILSQKEDKPEITEIYDIRKAVQETSCSDQGELVAQRVREYLGKSYKVTDNATKKEVTKTISYGDIVILMPTLTNKAMDIYNTLVAHHIPVVASFKTDGYKKEVRNVINLLRVVDNPLDDIALVGSLIDFGSLTEDELATVKVSSKTAPAPEPIDEDTAVPTMKDKHLPFVELITHYKDNNDNEIAHKIDTFLSLVDEIRMYSYSSTVDNVVLRIINKTDYARKVSGMPNGTLRVQKLYSFIDGLKGNYYAQSVPKFLQYMDDTEDTRIEEGIACNNAVRIMTMHASKGLEFPVVIVAGGETQTQSDRMHYVKNKQVGLALKHYDFDTMYVKSSISYEVCSMLNKVKTREEKMRLLYVALTRPMFALNIIATVTEKKLMAPPLPADASSHIDLILYALSQKYHLKNDITDTKNGLTVNLHNGVGKLTANDESKLADQQPIDIATKLNWRYSAVDQCNMPTKLVSSKLDGEYIYHDDDQGVLTPLDDEESKPQEPKNDNQFIGTAYHKVYQYVSLDADEKQIKATIDALVAGGDIEQCYADKLDIALIHQTLNNPQLRKIMDGGDVYHEKSFMLYESYDKLKDSQFTDKVMLQGVIDLLVIKGDKAYVVDFKYTQNESNLQERYKKQLQSYKMAVEKIGIKDVSCYILSIKHNKLISC